MKKGNNELSFHNRNELINNLSEITVKFKDKLMSGKNKNLDSEKVKIAQFKAVIYACNTLNNILKDKQVDDIEKQLSDIKSLLISQEYNTEATKEEVKEVEDIINDLKM
jgi:hypothetical protein